MNNKYIIPQHLFNKFEKISESTIYFTNKFEKILDEIYNLSEKEWGTNAKSKGVEYGLSDVKKMIEDIRNLRGKDLTNIKQILIDVKDSGDYITYTTIDTINKEYGSKYDNIINGDMNDNEYKEYLSILMNGNLLDGKRREEKLGSFLNKLNVGNHVLREELIKRVKNFGNDILTKDETKYSVKIVEGADITKYYSSEMMCDLSNASSCLTDDISVSFYSKNPNTVKLIIVTNEQGKLMSRALLFIADNGNKYSDTIYGESILPKKMLIDFIEKNGIKPLDNHLDDDILIKLDYSPFIALNPNVSHDDKSSNLYKDYRNKYKEYFESIDFSYQGLPWLDSIIFYTPKLGLSNNARLGVSERHYINYSFDNRLLDKYNITYSDEELFFSGEIDLIFELDEIKDVHLDYINLFPLTELEEEHFDFGDEIISKIILNNKNLAKAMVFNGNINISYLNDELKLPAIENLFINKTHKENNKIINILSKVENVSNEDKMKINKILSKEKIDFSL